MLTTGQEKYLSTMDRERITKIFPFDPECLRTGRYLEQNLITLLPSSNIIYIGSSVLEIAGENDIDMSVVSAPGEFSDDLKTMKLHFGIPEKENLEREHVKWEFIKNGFQIELYLNGSISAILQEQINTHKILAENFELRNEYEEIKLGFNNKPWLEYMRAKMEFFNRVLGVQ